MDGRAKKTVTQDDIELWLAAIHFAESFIDTTGGALNGLLEKGELGDGVHQADYLLKGSMLVASMRLVVRLARERVSIEQSKQPHYPTTNPSNTTGGKSESTTPPKSRRHKSV